MMEINFDVPKDKHFGWKLLGRWVYSTLILEFLTYAFFVAFFYLTYYLDRSFIEVVNSWINVLTYEKFWIIPLITFCLLFFHTFFKIDIRYYCEVCDKRDYLRNMVAVSKDDAKLIKSGDGGRVVCKTHKKPYLKVIK